MDKILCIETTLSCTLEEAYDLFTVNEKLETWLTTKADVEPVVGGKYELFWNPQDRENDSTIGCKVLALSRPNYLNFEWKGPSQF